MPLLRPAALLAALAVLAPSSAGQCQNERLVPALPALEDTFGRRVALDGDWALVGAPAQGTGLAGSATFFRRDGEGWIEDATFGPPQPTFNDRFGFAVALSGGVAVVGAPGVDDAGPQDHGAVYVFRLVDGAWTEEQILLAEVPRADEEFGYAVSVDGDTTLVGAPQTTLNTGGPFDTFQGVAWLFEFDGSSWVRELAFRALAPQDKGVFGSSVHVRGDSAVVGSSNPEWLGQETAYVFRRNGDWSFFGEVRPPGFAPGERYSFSVSIDGLRLAVGAPTAPGGGRAYVFATGGGGSFTVEGSLQPAGLGSAARFGEAVALEATTAAVGAPGEVPAAGEEGRVRLYELDGVWAETAEVGPSDPTSTRRFGTSVALDGDRLLVGAPEGTSPAGSGAAYEFQLDPADCALVTDTKTISLSAGGTQSLALDAGADLGGLTFLVLGSISGTSPGLPLGAGVLLPLNVDGYFVTTIAGANSPPFVGTFGVLGPDGEGAAAISVPPGFNPGLAGLELHHAFVALEDGTNAPLFASNARVLQLLD